MICLSEILELKTEDPVVRSLAFSDTGNLGATIRKCGQVFDRDGRPLGKTCGGGEMSDASYCCGRFGFINADGHAYITDERGNLIKKIRVGSKYVDAISMAPNGFMACWSGCAFFDFNGKKRWKADVGVVSVSPAYYKGYWYVADRESKQLIVVRNGRILSRISCDNEVGGLSVCGRLLAVASDYLYLYDLSSPAKPQEVRRFGENINKGWTAFSPNCRYVAVLSSTRRKIEIYSVGGEKVSDEKFKETAWSLAWWNNRIAVGFLGKKIRVFRVRYPPLKFALLRAD